MYMVLELKIEYNYKLKLFKIKIFFMNDAVFKQFVY